MLGIPRAEALKFLDALRRELIGLDVRRPTEDAEAIRASKLSARHQLACKENMFLYHVALPVIASVAAAHLGPKHDIRGEYWGKFPEYMSGNAYRRQGHPFSKAIRPAKDTYASWMEPSKASYPINQSYPDLLIECPSFSVVFDFKFFETGDPERNLVEGIYEVLHYRSMPFADLDVPTQPRFGCYVAFDASPNKSLVNAWNKVNIKDMFWADADVYPIVFSEAA